MIISVVNKDGYTYFGTKMECEDSKAVLAVLEDNRGKEDLIVVQHDAVPTFVFYNSMHDNAYHFAPVYLAKWAEKPTAIISTQQWNSKQFWLFFAHTFPNEKGAYLESAKEIARPTKNYESKVAATYGFDKK